VTLEQRHAHPRFGLGQGARSGRLGHSQGISGKGHLPMLRNRRDQAQVLEVQLRSDHRMPYQL
jgi:hypothetical protein